MPLTERDRAILDFEAEWRRHVGAKEEAIRSDLELSPARYYQLLGRLIDTTDAQMHDPMLVKRLRRQRDAVRTTSGIEHPVHGAGNGSPSAAG